MAEALYGTRRVVVDNVRLLVFQGPGPTQGYTALGPPDP